MKGKPGLRRREPGLPGKSHDARGRRPSRSSRNHLRDECRELSSQGRPPATDRGWKDPKIRENQIHRENVDQRQSERRIALASDNLPRNHEPAAKNCSHPDSRSEERRGGKASVSTCRARRYTDHKKRKNISKTTNQ